MPFNVLSPAETPCKEGLSLSAGLPGTVSHRLSVLGLLSPAPLCLRGYGIGLADASSLLVVGSRRTFLRALCSCRREEAAIKCSGRSCFVRAVGFHNPGVSTRLSEEQRALTEVTGHDW